jgi:hypothetical protein
LAIVLDTGADLLKERTGRFIDPTMGGHGGPDSPTVFEELG